MKFVCLRYPSFQMTFKPDTKKEVNGEIIKTPMEIIQFTDGYYETDNEKKIKFIKKHKDFGVYIVEDESTKYQEKPKERGGSKSV